VCDGGGGGGGWCRAIIHKRPELLHRPEARNLLMFFLSTEKGLEYLEQIGWLQTMREEWGLSGPELTQYVLKAERRLVRSLHSISNNGSLSVLDPVPVGADGAGRTQPRQAPVTVKTADQAGNDIPMRDVRGVLSLPWNIQVRCGGPAPR
jgi:hypothetical protein